MITSRSTFLNDYGVLVKTNVTRIARMELEGLWGHTEVSRPSGFTGDMGINPLPQTRKMCVKKTTKMTEKVFFLVNILLHPPSKTNLTKSAPFRLCRNFAWLCPNSSSLRLIMEMIWNHSVPPLRWLLLHTRGCLWLTRIISTRVETGWCQMWPIYYVTNMSNSFLTLFIQNLVNFIP